MHVGFAKLPRQILDESWYQDSITLKVFTHLLITVSFQEMEYQGIELEKFSRLASISAIAKETGLSVQQVRTAIKKLKKAGALKTEAYSGKYTIFTIIYGENQEKQSNPELKQTSPQPQKQKQKVTPPPTAEEIQEMARQQGYSWTIEESQNFLAYNLDHGRRDNWSYAIGLWEKNRAKFQPKQQQTKQQPKRIYNKRSGRYEIDRSDDYERFNKYKALETRFITPIYNNLTPEEIAEYNRLKAYFTANPLTPEQEDLAEYLTLENRFLDDD